MFNDVTRCDFIKTAALSFLAVNTIGILPENAFAADNCAVKTRYGTFNGFIDENGVKTWLAKRRLLDFEHFHARRRQK